MRILCVLSSVLSVESLWSLWILTTQHCSLHLHARRWEPHNQCSSLSLLFIKTLSLWASTHGLLATVRKTRTHNRFPQTALFPEQQIQIPLLGSLINDSPGSLHRQLCSPSCLSYLIDWPYRLLSPSSHKSESCHCSLFACPSTSIRDKVWSSLFLKYFSRLLPFLSFWLSASSPGLFRKPSTWHGWSSRNLPNYLNQLLP